jgi:N-acetylmuramoyl-L-alanine amidase
VLLFWDDEEELTKGDDEVLFKIALGAGHSINTAGKRCLKALDPKETREWTLNDRICDQIETLLRDYEGYELLRLDDSDGGEEDIALKARVGAANNWNADLYLSIHHNAGANGTAAGGIVAYAHPRASATALQWRDAFYDTLADYTGLVGNRSKPKDTGDYYVLRKTKMPAVLLELGFMDSKTDVPVILTKAYSDSCAKAIVDTLVKKAGLKKKVVSKHTYRVQIGAFNDKEAAERLKEELHYKGYPAYITTT